MPVGTVKFFNTEKGYGFIAPDGGGDDSFVHITAVMAAGMSTLNKEQRLRNLSGRTLWRDAGK
ncbi:MAG: cold shock domain-containing protein [Sphingomonadales bacterium]|nr:cold shock domain-containing protein [Sphingomonadales bacterium]